MKFICLLFMAFAFIMGCFGNYANLRNLSENESKALQQELLDNWSDYHISYRPAALVFDPKYDDRKILLGGNKSWWWVRFRDQESWQDFVEANTTNQGDFSPVGTERSMTGLREILGPDNQLYGYIIHQDMDTVSTRQVDENTLRLSYIRYHQTREGIGPEPRWKPSS